MYRMYRNRKRLAMGSFFRMEKIRNKNSGERERGELIINDEL